MNTVKNVNSKLIENFHYMYINFIVHTCLKKLFYFLVSGRQNNRCRSQRLHRTSRSQRNVQNVSGTSLGNKNIKFLNFYSIISMFTKLVYVMHYFNSRTIPFDSSQFVLNSQNTLVISKMWLLSLSKYRIVSLLK